MTDMIGLWSLQPNGQLKARHLVGYDLSIHDLELEFANEILQPHQRGVILRNVDPDQNYSFWVEAFRKVDHNVDASGILYSSQILAASSPFEPSSNIPFDGSIESTLDGPDVGAKARILADLTANVQSTMGASPDVIVQQDYLGVPTALQYPITLIFTRQRGAQDVTALSNYTIDSYGGGLSSANTSLNNTPGDPNIGHVTITDPGTHPVGFVVVQSTYNGAGPLQKTVNITPNKADPPPQVNPTTPTNPIVNTFNNINALNTDTVLTSVMSQVANGTSIQCQAASLSFWVGSPSIYGSATLSLKWQWSADGVTGWTDVGSYVVQTSHSTPGGATKFGGYSGSPGTITCNQALAGLTNAVKYFFRLVGKSTTTPSPTYPEVISGSASLT